MTMPDPQLFIGMPIYQLGEERSTKGLVRALQKGDVPAMRTAARILQRYPSARFDVKPGTLLSIARAELASAFVQSGCDYWLSLDQDNRVDGMQAVTRDADDRVVEFVYERASPDTAHEKCAPDRAAAFLRAILSRKELTNVSLPQGCR